MNYDAFIAKYNGKSIDWDGVYGAQCVDLVAFYCQENGKPIARANAKDWWGHPVLTGAFDFITNNPADLKQVPPRGAIIIWNGNLAGSGGYGHIAIFDAVVSPGVFRSFDQNWGGMYCHFVTHNWNNVIGWMVPKATAPAPQGGEIVIPNADIASKLYRMLRPNSGASQPEIDGTAGKRSFVEFVNSGMAEVAVRDANLKAQADALANMQAHINAQNEAITRLTSEVNLKGAEQAKLIAQIADSNAEIVACRDTIADLQKQSTADTQLLDKGKPFVQWLTELIKRLKG